MKKIATFLLLLYMFAGFAWFAIMQIDPGEVNSPISLTFIAAITLFLTFLAMSEMKEADKK
jgi:hypothetical protein